MATSMRAFMAGVGTTFAILAVGFCGGLMLASTALQQESIPPTRVAAGQPERPPVRVVLPASNEPAQPPAQVQAALAVPHEAGAPQVSPPQQAQPVGGSNAEQVDTKKPEAEERKRRDAERRTKRLAEARAREQQRREQQQRRQAPEPQGTRMLAFTGDEPRSVGGGFFGN